MKILTNQRGFLTLDFVFAIVLVFTFTAILFVMCMTLTTASIVQYITFAAARNYAVGHQNQSAQAARAQLKYNQLIQNKVFAPLFSNGWFKINGTPNIGDISQIISGYQSQGADPNLFWGVETDFTAKILDFNVPGFGSTNPDNSGDPNTFKTSIGSYIGRDLTVDECMAFVRQRWTAIQALNNSYSQANGTYVAFADDGC